MDAAKAGDLITMRILHEEDPSLVHERSSGVGHTAAHWAAAKGHVGALTWLLDACSFDPNFANACGATALHSAAANGQDTCAALLVARGARIDVVDEIGESPCDVAVRMQRSGELIAMLGGDAARTGVFCGACEELPVVQEEEEVPVIELDKDAQRRWLGAAKAGDLDVMRAILEEDENLLYANGDGTNYGFSGNTAMHWAASKNHVECIRWLYARGMDPDVVNKGDSTPAHSAAGSGALESLRTLLHECGADINRANDVEERPIDIAMARGHDDVVSLLKTGATLEKLREEFLRQGSYTIKLAKAVLDVFAVHDASCRGLSEKSEIVNKIQSYVDKTPSRIKRARIAPKPRLRGTVETSEPVDETVTSKARDRANELLVAQDYTRAIASYSMAIRLDRTNATLFCERSAANLGAGKIEDALADAKTAVKLDKRLGIAYAAHAAALSAASLHAEAVKVCKTGLLEDDECDALRTQIIASERAIADDRAKYRQMWGESE
jgi:ankyrin repeat protein